jgi:hypothetical protein
MLAAATFAVVMPPNGALEAAGSKAWGVICTYPMKTRGLLALLLLCAACGGSEKPSATTVLLEPPPEGEGFQLKLEAEVAPGTEAWICDVKAMPNDVFANVNRVELVQTDGTHHLTLSTLGLAGGGDLEYGRYNCDELYGDSSLMENQIMFYGNQGAASDEMNLPPGVAAKIPAGLDVIHEMHYVNTGTEPVKLYSYINAWTAAAQDVKEGIWGGQVRDENINIPAMSEHSEWSRCVFNEDVEVIFLASHMHARGKKFTIRPFDGEKSGDLIYTNDDWHIPLITQYEKPISVKKGEGFEWACTWKNEDTDTVTYGSAASDEMCNLAIVHTPMSLSAACEVVETSDGVLWEKGD